MYFRTNGPLEQPLSKWVLLEPQNYKKTCKYLAPNTQESIQSADFVFLKASFLLLKVVFFLFQLLLRFRELACENETVIEQVYLSSFGQKRASLSPPTQYCTVVLRLTFVLSLVSYFYWHVLDMYLVTREGRGIIHTNYTQTSAVSKVMLYPVTHYSTQITQSTPIKSSYLVCSQWLC